VRIGSRSGLIDSPFPVPRGDCAGSSPAGILASSNAGICSITTKNMEKPLITSERIPHDCGHYHERIYNHDTIVAYILSEPGKGTYCFVNNEDQMCWKGYATVADAKEAFFKLRPDLN